MNLAKPLDLALVEADLWNSFFHLDSSALNLGPRIWTWFGLVVVCYVFSPWSLAAHQPCGSLYNFGIGASHAPPLWSRRGVGGFITLFPVTCIFGPSFFRQIAWPFWVGRWMDGWLSWWSWSDPHSGWRGMVGRWYEHVANGSWSHSQRPTFLTVWLLTDLPGKCQVQSCTPLSFGLSKAMMWGKPENDP